MIPKKFKDKELLTIADLAEILGVTAYSIHRCRFQGRLNALDFIPVFPNSRVYRITRESVERYLNLAVEKRRKAVGV